MAEAKVKTVPANRLDELKSKHHKKLEDVTARHEATVTKLAGKHDGELAKLAAKTSKQCGGLTEALKKIRELALEIDRAEALPNPQTAARKMAGLSMRIQAICNKHVK